MNILPEKMANLRRLGAIVCLASALVAPIAFGHTQNDDISPDDDVPPLPPPTANGEGQSEFQLNILIVDIARVRSTALAYQSIQQETERVRDLINMVYQERLADLQVERDALIDRESEISVEEFRSSIADLERRAVDLENKRRQNFANLERLRQEASNTADIQLNSVLASILRRRGASYILNQQSALVWPDAANVSSQAIELLDEILPSVDLPQTLR